MKPAHCLLALSVIAFVLAMAIQILSSRESPPPMPDAPIPEKSLADQIRDTHQNWMKLAEDWEKDKQYYQDTLTKQSALLYNIMSAQGIKEITVPVEAPKGWGIYQTPQKDGTLKITTTVFSEASTWGTR